MVYSQPKVSPASRSEQFWGSLANVHGQANLSTPLSLTILYLYLGEHSVISEFHNFAWQRYLWAPLLPDALNISGSAFGCSNSAFGCSVHSQGVTPPPFLPAIRFAI